jgi:GAF domain-containing protein
MTNREATTVQIEQPAWSWLMYNAAKDPVSARRGRVTAVLLVMSLALSVLIFLVQLGAGSVNPVQLGIRAGVIAIVLLALFVINRLGFTNAAGFGMALMALVANLVLTDMTGASVPGPAILIVPVVAAGLLGWPISAFVIAVLAIIGHLVVNVRADADYLSKLGSEAPGLVSLYAQLIGSAVTVWLFGRTANRALHESSDYGQAIVTQRQDLEARVDTQSRYLQATTTIARQIVGVRDVDQLLNNVVDLIRDTFNYYHVQVFLVDEEREYAVLRSSTGEPGRILLERGHRLPVGSLSVIGQVTAGGRSVIARDTDADAVHRRNELLPYTRSEMALALVAGDRIIGALDLQSTEPDAFGEDVIPILQSLGDQLAIAIENTRLYSQTQSSLRELEDLYGEATERSWAEFLAQARDPEKRQVYGTETKTLEVQRGAVVKRVLSGSGVIVSTGTDGRQSFLAAPVIVRNEVIGVLGVEPDGLREWTQDDVQLIQSIAERTALAVENARLYLQAQRAADRERLVNTIAGRLQRAPNLAMLLQSAAQELAQALGTESVYAEISLDQQLTQITELASETDDDEVEGQARPTESEEARAQS